MDSFFGFVCVYVYVCVCVAIKSSSYQEGLPGEDTHGYLKTFAVPKHFLAYSVECFNASSTAQGGAHYPW